MPTPTADTPRQPARHAHQHADGHANADCDFYGHANRDRDRYAATHRRWNCSTSLVSRKGQTVVLNWATAEEVDNYGFNLYPHR